MRNCVYPKVPNYYHDSVPDDFFTSDDLVLVEKLDGSNCKLCVYDDAYAHLYGSDIHEYNPTHGDVFISSKKTVRGRLSDPIDTFDDAFTRLVHALRDRVNSDTVLELHKQYNSPLILFGEHMVKHTLDYGYGENPPPAFIGFDVMVLTAHENPPANPFDERFNAFLPLDEAYTVFEDTGLETSPIVERVDDGVDPDSLHIPMSAFAAVQAEGVVMRSDSRNRRVKYVTETFRERAQESWGLHEHDAENGAALFTARYLTNARIRKTVNKLLYRVDADALTPSRVAYAAVADAWEEEQSDIRTISIPIVPEDVFERAEKRSAAVLDTMHTNAKLNNTTIDKLWEEYQPETPDSTTNTRADEDGVLDVDRSVLTSVLNRIRDVTGDDLQKTNERDSVPVTESIEYGLVTALINESRIHDEVDALADERGQDTGRWVITPLVETFEDTVWITHLGVIANLPVGITPASVKDALAAYITTVVEARDDVVIDEKPEDWQPNIEDANTDALGSFF